MLVLVLSSCATLELFLHKKDLWPIFGQILNVRQAICYLLKNIVLLNENSFDHNCHWDCFILMSVPRTNIQEGVWKNKDGSGWVKMTCVEVPKQKKYIPGYQFSEVPIQKLKKPTHENYGKYVTWQLEKTSHLQL